MLSIEAQTVLSLLKIPGAMDGQDIEDQTGLSEAAIKKAAVELRQLGLVKTTGAPDQNADDETSIDRLIITPAGRRYR